MDVELKVLQPNQGLGGMAGRLLSQLSTVLGSLAIDCVVVQGDTMTAMAGALASYYLRIPIAHVEAGLRTYCMDSPFPEEANRRIISSVSTWNFAPSATAAENLMAERVPGKIFVTGNTVVDALQVIANESSNNRQPDRPKRVIATIHRRENFSHLPSIFKALTRIADAGYEVFFPVHKNPAIKEAAALWLDGSKVTLIEPMDYLPWIGLLKTGHLIISDSGGLQEEAPVLGIPLLVARQETERPEVIDGGYGYLVGVNENDIVEMALDALSGRLIFRQGSPYGDGLASENIALVLLGNSVMEYSSVLGKHAIGSV